MSTVEVRRCTGRVLPGWQAALLVVEGLWTWYRRNWRATAISSLLQPLLFLVAFGVGFGTLIDAEGRGVPATGGVPYLMYLAPALLAVGAVQSATFESTYPILSAFKWQRTYWAVAATPVTPGQLAAGQLIWIALRLTLSGAVYLLVIALFGAVTGPGVLASLMFAVLCGMAFSAPLVAYAAAQDNEGAQFLLAALLQRGIGAPRDFEAAVAWYRRAANQGNRLAMLELAKAYELGLGIPANAAQAKTWRDLAQKKPDSEAQKKDDAASNQRADPRRSRP